MSFKPVTVYTWTVCPFCVRAKNLLKNLNIPYKEINLDGKDEELKALRERTHFRTVPQIFIGEEFIGGFQELSQLNQNGELSKKIKAD